MSVERAIRGFGRWTEKATFSAGGGSWNPIYPVSNLGVLPLAAVAQSASATIYSTRFLATLDKNRGTRLLGLCRHNITLQGKQRGAYSTGSACDFTINTTTNILTAAGNELAIASAVVIWTTAQDLPVSSPQIVEGDTYYAGTLVGSTFKLYPTAVDAVAETNAIDFVDAGTGTHTVLGPIVLRTDWEMTFPVVYLDSELEWEDDNWFTGQYTEEELQDTTWTRPIWLEALYLIKAIWIEVDDTANTAGFIQIGLCEIAQGWQATKNAAYGAQYGFEFRTKERVAWGGVASHERLAKPRVVRGAIKGITRDEALSRYFELLRQHDLDIPFLWFPRPSSPRHWLRETFLARNMDPGLAAQAYFNTDDLPYAHKEVL